MTGSVCPKPGLARRGMGYEAQVETCRHHPVPAHLNRLMVDKALALGTASELNCQERCLLMALVAHLDIRGTAGEQTAVWPGSQRLCTYLAIGESTLRRLKASLEDKGFILRKYDHLNRPLRGGAIDLKPFLLRVQGLCDGVGHTAAAMTKRQDDQRTERYDHRPDRSAQVLEAERPIRNPPPETSERTSSGGKEDRSLLAHRLAEAICPRITRDPAKQAEALLGSAKARSLWPWASRRHGERAVLALAIAGHAPHIKDPAAWFGWFATSAKGEEADLEGIARKLTVRSGSQAAVPADVPPELTELIDAFGDVVGREKALSYLARGQLQADEHGCLTFRAGGRTSFKRLTSDLAGPFAEAATKIGYAKEALPPL